MRAVGSRSQVWKRRAHHTKGGMQKADIERVRIGTNDEGRALYRYRSIAKQDMLESNPALKDWNEALLQARDELGLKGFVLCKGRAKRNKKTGKMSAAPTASEKNLFDTTTAIYCSQHPDAKNCK